MYSLLANFTLHLKVIAMKRGGFGIQIFQGTLMYI